jgi:hypothetical protein
VVRDLVGELKNLVSSLPLLELSICHWVNLELLEMQIFQKENQHFIRGNKVSVFQNAAIV